MKIIDNVYRLDSTYASYVYLIKGRENTLIDTGMPFNRMGLLKDLNTLGVEPGSIRHIYITHNDVDHIGNAAHLQALSGARLWASKADISYITGEKERPGFKKHVGRIFRVKKPKSIEAFVPGEIINGIQVLPAPGHTIGHVCFLYEDVLFAGDLFENKRKGLIPYPAPWTWDYEMLLQSIKNVYAYPFTWICPAHGQAAKRGDIIPGEAQQR